MADIPDEKVWQARADLPYRKLVDGGMVYDGEQKQVHHLNTTAAFVWEACQRGCRTGEIVQGLCRSFAVDSARARADVAEILGRLSAAGLLTP